MEANVKKLMDVTIFLIFASSILGVVASQVTTLEGDTTNFSAGEIVVLGLFVLVFVLGVVYTIAKVFF